MNAPQITHGVDLVEVERVRDLLRRHPDFETRVFTASEREYCLKAKDPAPHFAARFAAKEAALKALGLGMASVGIDSALQEIEVLRDGGAPRLGLTGRPGKAAEARGLRGSALSLSHTDSHAIASVVLWGTPR